MYLHILGVHEIFCEKTTLFYKMSKKDLKMSCEKPYFSMVFVR
jgi:hypothetical protein